MTQKTKTEHTAPFLTGCYSVAHITWIFCYPFEGSTVICVKLVSSRSVN